MAGLYRALLTSASTVTKVRLFQPRWIYRDYRFNNYVKNVFNITFYNNFNCRIWHKPHHVALNSPRVASLHRYVTVQMCMHRLSDCLLNVITSHHLLVLQVFEERAKEHDKYGGDPEHPHKLHIVTRVKSTMRRPYWERKVIKSLGLLKVGFDIELYL